jgi:hypothetical protein
MDDTCSLVLKNAGPERAHYHCLNETKMSNTAPEAGDPKHYRHKLNYSHSRYDKDHGTTREILKDYSPKDTAQPGCWIFIFL